VSQEDLITGPRSAPVPTTLRDLPEDSVRGGEALMSHLEALLSGDGRFVTELVTRPHPLIVMVVREEVALVFAPAAVWDRGKELLKPYATRFAESQALLYLLGTPESRGLDAAMSRGLGVFLGARPSADEIFLAVERGFELLDAKNRAERRGEWVVRYEYEIGELVDIARAMTTERDVDKLLGVILAKSRQVTGADAGSIYVVEGEATARLLRFKLTQNDSVSFDSREFLMPLNSRSIAGSAAEGKKPIRIADVYELPAGSTFGFDRRFDERTGYRTKSMLVAPLISQRDEVIGVIQLINKKQNRDQKLFTAEDVDREVIPFDARSEELLAMLAAQAAACLENALLYDEIRLLFEGFVKASVEAIESRDPTTSGHSRRVADLTCGLAKVVDKESTGPFRDALFSREDLRELEYASLLHDFGKIGVREQVLVKANKLYDHQLLIIRARFDYVVRSMEADILARKVRALERGASKDELLALDQELKERRLELDIAYAAILAANEPTVVAAGEFERIEALAGETYSDLRGEVQRLLSPDEVSSLSVKRGSLTPSEFDEIRSHVVHTFRFLSRIPWGKQFRRVPAIAAAHHERLNGTGYPNRLRAEEIPIQSKLMSIADIFDALTANDRPYKKAVPVERALDILNYGVRDGHLDPELVRIFHEARVWETAEGPRTRTGA
jgi:HD-GYP domain-containing protein (c-di-GMP phosphodiesterase class II)